MGIYLIQGDDQLVELTETAYNSEDLLQTLLAKYPSVLAGDQIDSVNPRRWLLIRREAGVPKEEGGNAWFALDHLFLDQDAIPTLVEVKLSSDTRSRREVVAQMLDYAANAVVYWPHEAIRAEFEAARQAQGLDPANELMNFLTGADPEEFWQKAKTNLQAGKIRMVFVADTIPPELRRIVEFLNWQMDPAEVLAVEIKQYVGQGLKTLVPRVIGQTAEAQQKKSASPSRQWDESSFLKALDDDDQDVASRIFIWAKGRNLIFWWGKGQKYGSCVPMLDHAGSHHVAFAMWTNGYLSVQFPHMKPPFGTVEAKRELTRRLKEINGVDWSDDLKYPSIWFSALRAEQNLESFLKTFDWIIDSYTAGKLV